MTRPSISTSHSSGIVRYHLKPIDLSVLELLKGRKCATYDETEVHEGKEAALIIRAPDRQNPVDGFPIPQALSVVRIIVISERDFLTQ